MSEVLKVRTKAIDAEVVIPEGVNYVILMMEHCIMKLNTRLFEKLFEIDGVASPAMTTIPTPLTSVEEVTTDDRPTLPIKGHPAYNIRHNRFGEVAPPPIIRHISRGTRTGRSAFKILSAIETLDGEMNVEKVSQMTELNNKTVSSHVRMMIGAGLLKRNHRTGPLFIRDRGKTVLADHRPYYKELVGAV